MDTMVLTDAGVDGDSAVALDGGGDDGGVVSYEFTWVAGAPPHSEGSRLMVAAGANQAVWLGGNDVQGIDDWSVRIFDGDSNAWMDRGVIADFVGYGTFSNGSATRLADGDVLFAGTGAQDYDRHVGDQGYYSSDVLRFGASDQALTRVAPLPHPRAFQASALLASGEVLLVGGVTTPDTSTNPDGGLPQIWLTTIADTCLRYDAGADRWRDAAPLGQARYSPSISALTGGDVVITGGFADGNVPLASVERYDPDADSWTTLAAMAEARAWHTQATLPSGRILVVGGVDASGNAIDSAEIYDPVANHWQPAAPLRLPVAMAASVRLGNGDVLVIGGFQNGSTRVAIAQVVVYQEATGEWQAVPSLSVGRFDHSAVQLDDGRVLVAAGYINDLTAFHHADQSEITSVPLP